MATETVKMSSKGQIVIPQGIRDRMGLEEGSVLAVAAEGDSLVLKKVQLPSMEEALADIRRLSKQYRKKLEAQGWTEKKVIGAVERFRKRQS